MNIAYVGSRTTKERNARGEGLKVFHMDERRNWNEIQCVLDFPNPSYQTVDREEKYLYSVHGDGHEVCAYEIDGATGKLERLNHITLPGANPVFITPDFSNDFLVVATLQGGAVYSIVRKKDGSLGEIVDCYTFAGKKEGDYSLAHQCLFDARGEYLFVPTQGRGVGYDALHVLPWRKDGTFGKAHTYFAQENAAPRHVAIHDNNTYLYLINERSNEMTYFHFDRQQGKIFPVQQLSTLPKEYKGKGQASAVVLTPDKECLIGSNRIHQSLVLYGIDEQNGSLAEINYLSCKGKTPRFMTFDGKSPFLYVANEDSDEIVEFFYEKEKKTLSATGRVIATESPVCITFLSKD